MMGEAALDGRIDSRAAHASSDDADAVLALPLGDQDEPLVKTARDEQRPAPAAHLPGEIIEPGRALVLSDFSPPAISAGERLLRFAYRMGVPGSSLASPFGKPATLRLLATVESRLPGERSRGMALRSGHFLINGVKTPIAQMDFTPIAHLTPPVERAVHGFGWLRDLAASGPREQGAPTAARILTAWLDANEAAGKGVAWQVGHTGHRLLNWLIHAPLLLSGKDKRLLTRTLKSVSTTARWLDRNVGKADDRLDEVAGWCAIIAAGLLLPDGKPRRLFGEAGLLRALGDLVGDDGGLLSRSPLGQMEAIALLTELVACYRAVDRDPPAAITAMLGFLVPPLLALTHSDGSLGSWQGGGGVSADKVATLIEASAVRTRPLKDVRQWGYQRVSGGGSVLQFDAAPPPLARHTRNGCASTLAFEMSHKGQRIVVNCGGAGLAGGQIPARIEQGLRASAAHSTLVLDDANSTSVLIKGKLGKGVGEVEIDRRTLELDGKNGGKATRLEASHDGYASRHNLVHRRILIMRDDGTELRGEDLLTPSGKRGRRGKIGFAIRFHIARGIELRLTDDKQGAGLALPDGSFWMFRVAAKDFGGELSIEESLWADGNGRPHPIQQLVVHGMAPRSGGSFAWLFKKMG